MLPLYLARQKDPYRLERALQRSATLHTPRKSQYQSSDGIVRFAHDVLKIELADYQEDIARHFVTHRKVAVRGPHGMGKTAIAAVCAMWLLTCFDGDTKVATTAGAWRQLTLYLWPEIRKWITRGDWSKLGIVLRDNKEVLSLNIRLPDKEMFAVASDNPALIEGAHASHIGYVFDEAKAIPAGVFDAAEGAFSTGDAYALAISTPGETSGRFYDIHARKPGYLDWWVRHVTLEEAIKAGRINPAWADQRKIQWGEHSAVYQNRVLGEFAANSDNAVIPLRWVEMANERWFACDGKGDGQPSLGVDVARFGEDKTTLARIVGKVLEEIKYFSGLSTMETVGHVKLAVDNNKQYPIAVDVIGVGAGVYDRLHEDGFDCIPVNVSEGTTDTDDSGELGFINKRSQVWWALREALDPEKGIMLALPPDDILTGDLTAPLWTVTSSGRIKVESKDDIRKRIGRSTDAADGLALAFEAANRPLWWIR